MYTFKRFIVLFENRISYLKQNTKPLDTSHDIFAPHKTTHDIIDHFANNADPTKNKHFTQWILHKYSKQQIRQEDAPRIKQTLSDFQVHKSKLEHKDINKYPTLNHLETALQPHLDAAPDITDRQKEKQLKETGATKVYDENGITVHKLNDMNGACIYGRGTKWCTAATKATGTIDTHSETPKEIEGHITEVHYGDNPLEPTHYTITDKKGQSTKLKSEDVRHDNMFHIYDDEGPMYVIQTPDNKKYQFHPKSRQYMNDQDQAINTKEFAEKYPQVGQTKYFKNTEIGLHSASSQKEFDDRFHNLFNKDDVNQEKIREGYKQSVLPEINNIKDSPFFNNTHADLYTHHPDYTDDHNVYKYLIQKKALTDDHIVAMKNSKDAIVHKVLMQHDDNYRKEILNTPNHKMLATAISASPELTGEELDKHYDNNKDRILSSINYALYSHPNTSDITLQKLYHDSGQRTVNGFYHPNASKEFIEKHFNTFSSGVQQEILKKQSPEKMKDIVNNLITRGGDSSTLHHTLIHYPHLSEQQLHSHLDSFKSPNIISLVTRNKYHPLPSSIKERLRIP